MLAFFKNRPDNSNALKSIFLLTSRVQKILTRSRPKPFSFCFLKALKINFIAKSNENSTRSENNRIATSRIYPIFKSRASLFVELLIVFSLLAANSEAATVTLTWNASTGSVAGYRVYYGTQSKNYNSVQPAAPTLLKTTSYTTPDLTPGTYYFAVKAFDSAGNSSDFSNEVTNSISAPTTVPKANFSSNKASGSVPLAVNFTDSSTGTISSRSWNFGDGTTSTAQNPSKVYQKTGLYTVTLTVNGTGGSNTMTKTNYISVTALTSTAPLASFSASPTSGTTATTFNFTNSSTGNATSWAWNFGDGTTSTAKNAIKTYSQPGTYTVTLKATGASGTNTATKTNYIMVSAATPIANFSAAPTTGAVPLSTAFKNASTGTISSYAWSFGDGGTSTESNPTHIYTKPGSYTVKLTATGPAGTNSKSLTSYINVASAGTATGGLVAAYNFEETTGTTVVDLSGKGNQGVIRGAMRIATGKYGKALSFDGVDDWVTVADSASLDLTAGMTLQAWVYPIANDGWRTIISKELDSIYYLYSSAGFFGDVPAMGSYNNSRVNTNPSSVTLPLNSWSHLAGTYDGSIQCLYINGALVAKKSLTGTVATSSYPLRIGGHSKWGEYFKGYIDDIRIYNRALSIGEIQTDMNTPVK